MQNVVSRLLCRFAFASSSPPSTTASYLVLRLALSLTRAHTISAPLTDEDKETTASPSESLDVSYGLNGALAARGVIVKEKVFHNLKKTELLKHGATSIDNLSGIPLYVRGDTLGEAPEISKAQFSKLLKQVTCHISSVSKIFVVDGVIGSPSNCDAKVRIISDNPSAMLSLSKILWETPSRAISHDSCPLTVYVASSMSSSARDILGFGSQASNGFAAADVERSSVILCGRAYANTNTTKFALLALAAPVISARGGLPLSARLLLSGDSTILLFAPEDTFLRCSELHKVAISSDAGVILSFHGAAPFFQTTHSPASHVIKKPTSLVIVMADSTGVVPAVSNLSSGQAAYHFLAGYQDGKFVPAFLKPPSPIEPLELAKALFLQVEESEIPSYLINANDGGRHITGKRLLELVKSTLCSKLPESKTNVADSKVRDLKRKYKSFLSGKFINLPEEFYF
ncbi:phosphoenolpyruvate carboxykinase (ATP)-like [Zingiber officinale]|uniref:phosphoenolpyruvate carboxykinase (ATP)-like n=1 Tax=Zingiber officinale TaxID=94328 RepID=UPI001C4AF7B3|nr:phosphoenolpyruvate carboxykinase (ATP)-like [Zingiber officinale]